MAMDDQVRQPAFDDDGCCLKCGSRISFTDVTDTRMFLGNEIVKQYNGDIANRNCIKCTHAKHLAYEEYGKEGYPISSGSMESFCEQLGQRLKGPGMRWNKTNVTPMATMVGLWANDQWDQYWKATA